MKHLTIDELAAGVAHIMASPKDMGELRLIARRPEIDAREVLERGQLDLQEGLVGDIWSTKKCSRTADGAPHPDMQLNIMNSRAIDLIAGSIDRWPLAGDQLYVDMDLSSENLPAGTRLAVGSAVIEITDQPHTGCKKFVERFGMPAMEWVNSDLGRTHSLRGINAKVTTAGEIRPGDTLNKILK